MLAQNASLHILFTGVTKEGELHVVEEAGGNYPLWSHSVYAPHGVKQELDELNG